jgi:peptide/nickel transport system substrate-binding protein
MRRVLLLLMLAGMAAARPAAAPLAGRTFTYAARSEVLSLDPQEFRDTFTAEFLSNIVEPLVRYDAALRVEPALALRWEPLTPTRLRFHLRPGVRFSNGNDLRADDVVFTFTRGSRPESPFRGALSGITSVTAAAPLVVDVESEVPTPLLLRMLTTMLVLDRDWVVGQPGGGTPALGASGESYLTRHVLGTGPYALVGLEPGGRVVLERHQAWWGGAATPGMPARAVYQPIRTDATRTAALLSGQVDAILATPLQDLARLRQARGVELLEAPSTRTVLLAMNQQAAVLPGSGSSSNPFKDVRVRRALAHAIDTGSLVSRLLDGHAVAALSIVAPGINGADPALDTRLPSEAGYPSGFALDFDCPNDSYLQDELVCGAVRAMLARVGVRVRVQLRDRLRHMQAIASGHSALHLFGWAASTTNDAHNVLVDLLHTPSRRKGTWNTGGYANAQVDALEARVATERDPATRQRLITEALRLHGSEVGHVPLYVQPVIWARRDGVRLTQTPIDALWLRLVRLD